MTILSDRDILPLLQQGLVAQRDGISIPSKHVNPASIDICIGHKCIIEMRSGFIETDVSQPRFIDPDDFTHTHVGPGEFILVETLETFNLPHNIAMDLRLKSSIARMGWNHSLAFWVDPGWNGVLTMEIQNITRYQNLYLEVGQRFAQVIVHQLSSPALNPYKGRYQNSTSVTSHKEEKWWLVQLDY